MEHLAEKVGNKEEFAISSLCFSSVIFREEGTGILDDHASKQNQREQVRNGHEPVANVCRVPEELHADQRAGRGDQHVQDAVDPDP